MFYGNDEQQKRVVSLKNMGEGTNSEIKLEDFSSGYINCFVNISKLYKQGDKTAEQETPSLQSFKSFDSPYPTAKKK